MNEQLDEYFGISKQGSTVEGEIRAGVTTFLTMAYILFVNPSMLELTGIPFDDALFATAVAAFIACVVMGLWANLPFALAPVPASLPVQRAVQKDHAGSSSELDVRPDEAVDDRQAARLDQALGGLAHVHRPAELPQALDHVVVVEASPGSSVQARTMSEARSSIVASSGGTVSMRSRSPVQATKITGKGRGFPNAVL